MSLRTKSREFAMQMLFQWDVSHQEPTKLEAKFWRSAKAADITREFANRLFEGAAKEVTVLDEIIVKQAVYLAKKFSGEDSGAFVNGILDTFRKTLNPQ